MVSYICHTICPAVFVSDHAHRTSVIVHHLLPVKWWMNEYVFVIYFEVLLWIQQTPIHKCCNKNASRDLWNLWKFIIIHGSFITVLTHLKLFLQNYKCLLKKCQATWSGKHSDLLLSKIIDKNGAPHCWQSWKTSDESEVISFDMSLENGDHLRPFICIQIYEKKVFSVHYILKT